MIRSTGFSAVIFTCLLTISPLSAADWNQWRGPEHDGLCRESGLRNAWPEGGPKLLWRCENMGEGYSNLSFADGRIFSMGDNGDECYLYALDVKNGEGIWGVKVGPAGGNYPGPRCTPATDGKLVFALGQFGDFVCVDAKIGKEHWRVNVAKEYGGRVMSMWNFSMSPILDDNRVVLPVGGDRGTLIAFERSSAGPKVLWQSQALTDAAGYDSAVPIDLGGVRQYLVFTDKRLAGIDAKTGDVLWQVDREGRTAICSDPVVLMDGPDACYVMVSSAYNIGADGFKITAEDSGKNFRTETLFHEQRLQNHHGGLVRLGEHVYFLTQRELVCVEMKTGKTLWNDRSVGKGSILGLAENGKLIVRGEGGDGVVALVEASTEGYKEISRFAQPDRTSKNSWTYPTVHEGKLYIRDQHLLLCYDIQAE